MRKTALLLATTATVALTLGTPGSAAAHNAGPCNDESGGPGHSDYATHHIVAAAHDGALGNGGHKPGTHMGYSACLGVHG